MQVVDGSRGGGQLIRAAVSFAALTGESVRVVDARSTRDSPGLKAQHVAAITVAAQVCDASVEDVRVGATEFEFDPGTPKGGSYEVDIGTAGSITLVFDTILPIATSLSSELTLTVEGGTDVRWAPTLDYYRHVKLPMLHRIGVDARIELDRRGFYPGGGGSATLSLTPSDPSRLEFEERGSLERIEVRSTASNSLADADVADRQAAAATQHLPDSHPVEATVEYVDTRSPGSVLDVIAHYEHTRAGFSSLGRRGKPAEAVATDAVANFAAFRVSTAAVDRYLADQLLPFLALAGGTIRTSGTTNHIETHVELLQQFGYDVTLDTNGGVTRSAAGRTD